MIVGTGTPFLYIYIYACILFNYCLIEQDDHLWPEELGFLPLVVRRCCEIFQGKKQGRHCCLLRRRLIHDRGVDRLHIHRAVDMIFLIDPLLYINHQYLHLCIYIYVYYYLQTR